MPIAGDAPTIFTNINIRFGWVAAGGVAGNQTVVGGIKAGDPILSAVKFTTAGLGSAADITSEIVGGVASADDVINNLGGTNLTSATVALIFLRKTAT